MTARLVSLRSKSSGVAKNHERTLGLVTADSGQFIWLKGQRRFLFAQGKQRGIKARCPYTTCWLSALNPETCMQRVGSQINRRGLWNFIHGSCRATMNLNSHLE